MVREVTQPSARYTGTAAPNPAATSSRIPVASTSRIPYTTSTSKSASATSATASTARRPILGERHDLTNISITSSAPVINKKTINVRPRLTPKKPITIITRITSSPASSLASRDTSVDSRAGATPYARMVSPSMETRVFRFDQDDTMLLDMEPPSSIAGMSSPGTEYDEGEHKPTLATRGFGRMMTPANSQDLTARTAVPAPVVRNINRLPTPPSSQHAEEGGTTFRSSRIRPREAPTPPRRHLSKELLASPVQDPSPNPRRKKSPRVDVASPSRPTVAHRPSLSGLSRLAGKTIPSTPISAAPSQPIPIRVVPSTAPPPRRARASTAPKKVPVKSAKARQSLPSPAQRRQSTPRARQSMTPDAIVALTGKPLGFLPKKIEAEPGDDPLILKGLEDDDEWLERRKLSRSQTASSKSKSKKSPSGAKVSSLSGQKDAAGPSRLREVMNRPRTSDASSLGSPVRQAGATTIYAESPSVARSLRQYLAENEYIQPEGGNKMGMYDLQFDALPEWGSDDDSDVGGADLGDDAFVGKSGDDYLNMAPQNNRHATPADDIDPEPLPPSSPAWTGRNLDVSTTPQGTPPPFRAVLSQPTPRSPVSALPLAGAESRSLKLVVAGAAAAASALAAEDEAEAEVDDDHTQDAIAADWDDSDEALQSVPGAELQEERPLDPSPIQDEDDVTAEALNTDWDNSPGGQTLSDPVEEATQEAGDITLEAASSEWDMSAEKDFLVLSSPAPVSSKSESRHDIAADITAEAIEAEWDAPEDQPIVANEQVTPVSPIVVSETLPSPSTTPAGSPIRPDIVVPVYVTPLKFATPAQDRRQSRVSLRVATPFQRAASEPVTPPTSSECGDDLDLTQNAVSAEWDISVEGAPDQEKALRYPAEVEIAPEASSSSPSLSSQIDDADTTHDAVDAEWEDEVSREPVDESPFLDEERPEGLASPVDVYEAPVTAAVEAAVPEQQEESEPVDTPSSPFGVAGFPLPELSINADITAEAIEADWNEAEEDAAGAATTYTAIDNDIGDHAPPSPAALTHSAVAFLMASVETATVIDEGSHGLAEQAIGVKAYAAVSAVQYSPSSRIDSALSPFVAESPRARAYTTAQAHSPAERSVTLAHAPTPSPRCSSPSVQDLSFAPSSPVSSVAGDETQEAIPDAWDLSVDHSALSFEENIPHIEVESPESHAPDTAHFDFSRDQSPLEVSPAKLFEILQEGRMGEDSIGGHAADGADDSFAAEVESQANAPADAEHDFSERELQDGANSSSVPEGTEEEATGVAGSVDPVQLPADIENEEGCPADIAEEEGCPADDSDNDEAASERSSDEAHSREEDADQGQEAPDNSKIVLKVVDRGIVKVERLTCHAEVETTMLQAGEDEADADVHAHTEAVFGEDNSYAVTPNVADRLEIDPTQGAPTIDLHKTDTPGQSDEMVVDSAPAHAPTPALASASFVPQAMLSAGDQSSHQAVSKGVHRADPARQIPQPTRRPASVQSAGMSAVEAMLIRRQSASSSTSSRPSKLSLVAAAASSTEAGSSAAQRPSTSRSYSRRSLGDEIASATATDVEEEVGNESFKSVVEVSSLDPRAAARAAAILKMNHAYIEHGILPSTTPTPSSSHVPLPKTPVASSSALPRTPRSARSARRRAFESKHFDTLDSARKLNREGLLYEAELEIVACRRSRARSRARSLGTTEGGYASDETELPVPGGWRVTPGKRKRSGDVPSRLQEDPSRGLDKGKGREEDGSMHTADERPWGVFEWKKLEKVYRAEKEVWMKEREVKPLPGLFGWARKALGGEADAKEWDNERVVKRFLDQEKAHGLRGEWAENMIRLRVKALEKRVNAPRPERSTADERRDSKKQRVEEQRREHRGHGATVPATPARDDLGDSTVVSIVPPSTIRRMLGYVWRPAAEADTSLASIASEDMDDSQGVDNIAPALAAPSTVGNQPRVENKLLTRLKEARDGGRPAPLTPSTPIGEHAPSTGATDNDGPTTASTPMRQIGSGLFSPAHPASPAWSPAIPGEWVSGLSSSRPAASSVGISGSPRHTGPSTPGTTYSASATSVHPSTPKLYPSLNPPLTQRSSALQALFDTPGQAGASVPTPRDVIGKGKKDSPSVRDMVRSFEEDGVLGRGYSKEGLKRAESKGL